VQNEQQISWFWFLLPFSFFFSYQYNIFWLQEKIKETDIMRECWELMDISAMEARWELPFEFLCKCIEIYIEKFLYTYINADIYTNCTNIHAYICIYIHNIVYIISISQVLLKNKDYSQTVTVFQSLPKFLELWICLCSSTLTFMFDLYRACSLQ
jgi:hypothetical protein